MTRINISRPQGALVRLAAILLPCWFGAGCRPDPPTFARESALKPPAPASTAAGSAEAPRAMPDPTDLGPSTDQAEDRASGTIRFRDATEASGIDFVHCSGASPEKIYPTANGSGLAMIDYDNDGKLDLYFASTRNLPLEAPNQSKGNKLFRNKGDGTFEDVTAKARVGFNGFNHGVCVGDLDGNGWPDLYLTTIGNNVLYLNQGDGTFRDASAGSGANVGPWSSGSAVLDYDSDGDLDLYVTCYGTWPEGSSTIFAEIQNKGIRTYASPKQITPSRHYLLRNRGNATFEDVTEAAGILRKDGRGLGVLACDLNQDGRVDIFVANDMCPNFLFLNRGDGTFEDASESSGAALSEAGYAQAGMGVDAEDLNGDGLPEIIVTHFREDYDTLYRNLGKGLFRDVSASAGVIKDSMPNVGWGCALADFDNDGHPDLFVVNGHVDDNLSAITGLDVPQAEPPKVWRNLGDGRFRIAKGAGAYFDTPQVARGAAFGDLDDDGDVDVVVSRLDARPAILLNDSEARPWIRLDLRTGPSHRPAIGASIDVHAGGKVLRRHLKGGGSYLSSNDPRLLVGLGSSEKVDRVEIRWPGGRVTTLNEPALRQTYRVDEPTTHEATTGEAKR